MMRGALAVGMLVLGLAGAARADVVNGDFESSPDLTGWTPGGYGYYAVELLNGYLDNSSKLAHLHASATYTWDGMQWSGTWAGAYLQQIVMSAPDNATQLSFDAMVASSGVELNDPYASIMWNGGSGDQPIIHGNWHRYVLPLADLGDPVEPGSLVVLAIQLTANAPTSPAANIGDQVIQTMDVYVDNVQLVPAPGAAALLVLGSAGVLRRRRMMRD
jgi:hypothetical protein